MEVDTFGEATRVGPLQLISKPSSCSLLRQAVCSTQVQEGGSKMADFEDSGAASGSPWSHAESSSDVDGASVLLVEDDPDCRDLMRTLLQLDGFSTTTCGTAELALEQLREQHFDLMLTDYMLPRRTGGWLLQQASREGLIDGTPVLVLTAHPNPPDVPGFEVIRKPCDLDDLLSRIRTRLPVM